MHFITPLPKLATLFAQYKVAEQNARSCNIHGTSPAATNTTLVFSVLLSYISLVVSIFITLYTTYGYRVSIFDSVFKRD